MGWLQQCYKQSQYGRSSGGIFAGRDVLIQRGLRGSRRRQLISCIAAIATAALLVPLQAAAFETASSAQAMKRPGVQMLSEEELRRVFGRALPEDRLFHTARFLSNGFAVDILGDMATLLTPLPGLLDADVSFRDALFNPINPHVLIDRTGAALIRVPESIGMLSFENIRIRGSNTSNFGSVTIRNIDLRGTTIRVTVRN